MGCAASTLGPTVRTSIIPYVASSILEGITAKIGTSIASIVLDRVTDKPNPKTKNEENINQIKIKIKIILFQLTKSLKRMFIVYRKTHTYIHI